MRILWQGHLENLTTVRCLKQVFKMLMHKAECFQLVIIFALIAQMLSGIRLQSTANLPFPPQKEMLPIISLLA